MPSSGEGTRQLRHIDFGSSCGLLDVSSCRAHGNTRGVRVHCTYGSCRSKVNARGTGVNYRRLVRCEAWIRCARWVGEGLGPGVGTGGLQRCAVDVEVELLPILVLVLFATTTALSVPPRHKHERQDAGRLPVFLDNSKQSSGK